MRAAIISTHLAVWADHPTKERPNSQASGRGTRLRFVADGGFSGRGRRWLTPR
jgi:hypothetical protein